MVTTLLLLAAGVAAAAVGADLLVRGSVGLAQRWRLPPAVIGVTIAAFGTSGPELAVAIRSAAAGRPEIAVGDVLGSNLVNLGLVLGVALLFGAIAIDRPTIVRDIPLAAGAPLLVLVLLADGMLSRRDATMLLLAFAIWLGQVVLAARSQRRQTVGEDVATSGLHPAVGTALGLALLALAGSAIVAAANRLMDELGWSGYAVGIVFVAISTSAPEIATMVMARVQRQDGVGLGTVLGSNIFNTLWIIGVAGLVHPVVMPEVGIRVVVGLGVLATVLVLPRTGRPLPRARGLLLLAAYLAAVALTTAGLAA